MTQKPVHLETEPIFNVHIEFCDGSKPIDYYNLNLKQTTVVLQEWSEDWILIPEKDCRLDGDWNWHANVRRSWKPKDREKPIDKDPEPEDTDPVGVYTEFSEPEE